jgi:hypothetical protein
MTENFIQIIWLIPFAGVVKVCYGVVNCRIKLSYGLS